MGESSEAVTNLVTQFALNGGSRSGSVRRLQNPIIIRTAASDSKPSFQKKGRNHVEFRHEQRKGNGSLTIPNSTTNTVASCRRPSLLQHYLRRFSVSHAIPSPSLSQDKTVTRDELSSYRVNPEESGKVLIKLAELQASVGRSTNDFNDDSKSPNTSLNVSSTTRDMENGERRGSDLLRLFLRSRNFSPSLNQAMICKKFHAPRMSLLGKPILFKTNRSRNFAYRNRQMKLYNFFERPTGRNALAYHLAV